LNNVRGGFLMGVKLAGPRIKRRSAANRQQTRA
jgi:hypothetical protein